MTAMMHPSRTIQRPIVVGWWWRCLCSTTAWWTLTSALLSPKTTPRSGPSTIAPTWTGSLLSSLYMGRQMGVLVDEEEVEDRFRSSRTLTRPSSATPTTAFRATSDSNPSRRSWLTAAVGKATSLVAVATVTANAVASSDRDSIAALAAAEEGNAETAAPAAVPAAEWAYRASAVDRRTGKANLAGTYTMYQDRLEVPQQSSRMNQNKRITVQFEYPADWLELDRATNQAIQYVDQRNGDKLYVFRVPLPVDKDLQSTPKSYFGRSVFDPQASLARTGTVVEDYRIMKDAASSSSSSNTESSTGNSDPPSLPHRRLQAKYTTVTPNGVPTERRGIFDMYQVDDYAFVLMTASNANKFLAGGVERDTVEHIADSFRITAI